jgi:hypothetical protein
MTRTLKALGLALLAVCALSVAASSASATVTDKFTCTKDGVNIANCDITGTGSNSTFGAKDTPGLTVTCSTETFTGTVTNNSTEVTVAPHYTGCTAFGGNAPIDTNSCHYVLKGTTTTHKKTDETTNETDAGVTLSCPNPELGIVITGPGCTISVETTHTNPTTVVNHDLHGVIYDNEGSGNTDDVKVTVTVDTIKYTAHGFGCAVLGLATTETDGFLTGSVTVKGYGDKTAHATSDHVGIKVD